MVPAESYARDRFDDVPRDRNRVGAHRAENPRLRMGVVLLWAALAAVLLFVVGVVGMLALQQRQSAPAPQSSSDIAQTAGNVDTTYTVLVLNASGDDTRGGEIEQKLRDAGWAEGDILPVTADEQGFETTTVFYVDDADREAAVGLAQLVGAREVQQDGTYAEAQGGEKSPLTVVIGVDADTK